MACDTGLAATLTLATTTEPAVIKSMTLPEFTLDKLETSSLATTNFKSYCQSDLAEPGEMSIEFYFDATADSIPTFGTAPELVTVTFPINTSGNTTNATLTATGFVTAYKLPDLSVGELQMGTMTLSFDGATTEPTWSAESA